MQTIQGIAPLWDVMPLTRESTAQTEGAGRPFTDIFQSAIDAVKETDAEKVELEYLLATGQLDDPSQLSIASTKAGYAVDLLVQLRNKAVEAYDELMRISI